MSKDKHQSIQAWLDTATRGIRFRPDRAAVERELQEHIEDKLAGLQRIYPDMTAEEAETMALSQMGDPAEIGRELAKVHKPWLGYLWRCSQIALGVLIAVFFITCVRMETSMDNPVMGGYYPRDYVQPQGLEPEKAELGGYTFQIMEAIYEKYPDNTPSHSDGLAVTLRVYTPRFWARIDSYAVQNSLTVVDGNGREYTTTGHWNEHGGWEAEVYCDLIRWGVFYREFAVRVDRPWEEGEPVRLEFHFAQGDITLSAQVTEVEMS